VEWGGTASCWGGRVTLACGEGAGPLPLAILDGEGRPLAQKSLEDGESLAFRGYVFQAAPEGIRVTSRPGTFLLGTGMAALVAGCAWMFHLKPRLRKGRAGAKP
jgi:hypothetical protein